MTRNLVARDPHGGATAMECFLNAVAMGLRPVRPSH